ncbi:MAG: GspH/FimT family pseudopilin [Burkholderiales bacterium]
MNTKSFGCHKRAGAIGSRGDSSGFTLIESLTVVAIVAILAASSSAAFQRFIVGARITDGTSTFRSALEFARSEAAMRGVRVGVCRSTNANESGASCSDAAAGNIAGNDWSAGWIVYAKAAANANDTFEGGDTLIRRQASLASAGVLSRLMIWAPGAGAIVYNWNGMRVAGPSGVFAFDYGKVTGALPVPLISNLSRCMAINIAGRIDFKEPVNGSCQS